MKMRASAIRQRMSVIISERPRHGRRIRAAFIPSLRIAMGKNGGAEGVDRLPDRPARRVAFPARALRIPRRGSSTLPQIEKMAVATADMRARWPVEGPGRLVRNSGTETSAPSRSRRFCTLFPSCPKARCPTRTIYRRKSSALNTSIQICNSRKNPTSFATFCRRLRATPRSSNRPATPDRQARCGRRGRCVLRRMHRVSWMDDRWPRHLSDVPPFSSSSSLLPRAEISPLSISGFPAGAFRQISRRAAPRASELSRRPVRARRSVGIPLPP